MKKISLFIYLLLILSTQPMAKSPYAFLENTYDFELNNGLKVTVYPSTENALILYKLVVNTGNFDEPIDKNGVFSLMYAQIAKGTTSRDANDIASTIDAVGGSISGSIGNEVGYITCQVITVHKTLGLDLFADVIQNPTFPEDELALIKSQWQSNIRESYTDTNKLITKHSFNLLEGTTHKLGRELTEETLEMIRKEDIRAVYDDLITPQNSHLLIMGDVSTIDIKIAIESKFGAWKNKNTKSIKHKPPKMVRGKKRLVHKPNLTQTIIRYIGPGISVHSPDFPAFMMMNLILGGEGAFSTRLMTAVRTKLGNSYGAYSKMMSHSSYGVYYLQTFTKHHSLTETLTAIDEVIADMIKMGVTQVELADAKAYYLGSIPLRTETIFQKQSYFVQEIAFNLSKKAYDTHITAIQKLSVQDINKAIRRYLDPTLFNSVLLTDVHKITIPTSFKDVPVTIFSDKL